METINGYEIRKETMQDIIYVRMKKSMINQLKNVRSKTGIPVSEIIRESVKQTLHEIDETGSLNIKIN